MISLETTPAGILPGQRIISGIRKAPSQLEFFSLRNGVMPPSGQVFMCGPLSVRVDDDGVLGDAQLVEQVEQLSRRACRGRSSCRDTGTATVPAWPSTLRLRCGCAGACGWC